MMNEHTAKAFDDDLQELTRKVAEMGGLAEREIADCDPGADAAATPSSPSAWSPPIRRIDALQQRDRGEGDPHHRAAPADGGRSARDRRARSASPTISSGSATSPRTSASASVALDGDFHPQQADRAASSTWRRSCSASSSRCSTPMPAATSPSALAVWKGDEEIDAHVHLAVPRAAHLHDGRPAQHHVLHPSAVLRQEHRAHRRPRHQHRRDRALHGRRPPDRRPAAEGRHHGLRQGGEH